MESVRKRNRILLVDDEPDLTMTFKAILQIAGFVVDAYEDPLIALSYFKPGCYDLVILDIKMPKMNGFELYAEMRKVDSQIKICFIITGEMYYDEVKREKRGEGLEEEEEYCKLDTERFLQKPISNVDPVNRIDKIVMLNKSSDIQNT